MLGWRPTSKFQQANLIEETLSHARAVSNVLTNLLEQRAVVCDDGGGPDLCDSWDLFGLSDVLSSLLEITTIVSRRTCPERTEEPQAATEEADAHETTIDTLWLAGGNGNGVWVDARVKESAAPANPDAVDVVLRNGLLHPAGCNHAGE